MHKNNAIPFWTVPVVLACAAIGGAAHAATDIADVPLITSASVTQVPPNLMFVLDDSGSMGSAYMPDDMDDDGAYGYYASQCNGLAFNPDQSYLPPIKADGTSYGNSSFGSAWTDGYAQSGSVNLGATTTQNLTQSSDSTVTAKAGTTGSKTFTITGSGLNAGTFTVGQAVTATGSAGTGSRTITGTVSSWTASSATSGTLVINATSITGGSGSDNRSAWTISYSKTFGTNFYYTYNTNVGTQTAMGWTYQASGTNVGKVDRSTRFYTECMTGTGSSSTVFTQHYINDQSAEIQQKYANWYSYYRTRTLLMRTAVGRALSSLDSSYNVGFSTINSSRSKPAVTGDGFHPLGAFTGAQRGSVYDKLYGAAASGNTPLRGALSTMGRYYAGKFVSQTVPDPIQYSCQRNYTLLTTDGYWNTGNESTSTPYGPYDVGGSKVGQQDGIETKPMWDGATSSNQYSRTLYSASSTKYSDSECTRTRTATTYYYKVTTSNQTSTNNSTWSTTDSSISCMAGSTVVYGSSTAASLTNGSVSSEVTTSSVLTGGASNTLADVAQYYYKTDLRPRGGVCSSTSSGTTQSVCEDKVPTSGRDTANWQHMTTFTVGLGVNGTLTYDPNYLTQTTGDYVNLTAGAATWPVPQETTNGGDARQIDDLWHAAVNGRGQYYSALNASQLSSAIQSVLNSITAQRGASSAATTSTLNLVAGDRNKVYGANYVTANWTGDLKSFTLNGTTGAITTQSDDWSAQAKLTATTYTSRNIYYRKPSTGALTAFNWTNLSADSFGSYFTGLCSAMTGVTQCTDGSLGPAEKTAANDGATLVNYLRGERANEAANAALGTNKAIYRKRVGEKGDNQGVLGDIINGAPLYVGKPSFPYSDAGYSSFASARSGRKPVVYVGANDGMLHAFSADSTDGGTELWAFVPTAVMPYMHHLADSGYATKHRYFVDGAPVMGDVYINGAWRTILVGGLGKGGNSYYALDITDPTEAPVLLWEFTDTNMGWTFGNPVITKRADGKWVVAFTSGYNNADGQGHLYVVDAADGALLADISTGAGTAANPSGLAKINGWIDNETDNTSKRFYGGDLLGNLWRFDVDGLVEPKNAALLMAKFQINASTPQPVTTQPRLTMVANQPVIIVGTGRYLGTSDITDTTQQTVYAIKDSLTNTSLGDARQNNTLVRQTLTPSGTSATVTNNPVDWATKNGWWVDLPHSGERVATTDIAMIGGVLSVSTALPSGDACQAGGGSWNYYLSTSNGGSIQNTAGELVSDSALVVGQGYVVDANGTPWIVRQMSDGGPPKLVQPPSSSSSNITPQRTSWRELVD